MAQQVSTFGKTTERRAGTMNGGLMLLGLLLLIGGTVWWDPLESTCRHASLSIL